MSTTLWVGLAVALGLTLGVILIQVAKASTRHVVTIGPTGTDPSVCIIDRNDSVAFRNDTGERIWLYLPDVGTVVEPLFDWYLNPGETSHAVEWNLRGVRALFEVDGVVVATVKTTDDPVNGCVASGREPWRIVIGGIAGG